MSLKHHSDHFVPLKLTDTMFHRRHTLKTASPPSLSPPVPHPFKHRIYSLLTSVNSLKETFNKKRKSWIEKEEGITIGHSDDTESSLSLSDCSSEENLLTPPSTPSKAIFSEQDLLDTSLSYSVKSVLGHAFMEADNETDKEWEESREALETILNRHYTFAITL
ncbi:hypothetical protein BY458DRAFT_524769 [Sporodiniella umbellata]|nr:hypothetical protein BY458DRAFT_524769 [Sporodiniella umbellata]